MLLVRSEKMPKGVGRVKNFVHFLLRKVVSIEEVLSSP